MILLTEVQSLTASTISAHAYFTGETVIADDGTKQAEVERALIERGFVVIVDKPFSGSVFRKAPGVAILDVVIGVHLQINPRVNAAQADPVASGEEAIINLAEALLGYGVGNESDRYEVDDEFFQLVVTDEGLECYVLAFRKMVAISY